MINVLLNSENSLSLSQLSQRDRFERLRLRFSQKLLKKHIPTELKYSITDPWPGSLEKAHLLLQGCFDLDGVFLETHTPDWTQSGLEEKHLYRLNNFEWLRDLKTLGGETARQKGRQLIKHWIEHNTQPQSASWSPPIMAMRLYNWIAFYSFFCQSATDEFKELFFESLTEQLHRLSQVSARQLDDMTQIRLGRILCIAGLVLEEYHFLYQRGLTIFSRALKDQILLDGGHISRSPAALIPLLCAAHDVRMCLQLAHKDCPLLLQSSIERMNNALKFFCYNDKQLALFHGTQQGDPVLLSTLLSLAGSKQRQPRSLPQSGFERIAMGRSLITLDVGNAAPRGHDQDYHASALAFEFCYGKQRVFVNCGTHPYSSAWKNALRHSAAHNTAQINAIDSAEILGNGSIGRQPLNIHHEHEDIDGGLYISAMHDGFLSTSGIKHYRQVGTQNRGKIIAGQDHFEHISGEAPASGEATIRFHTHPSVRVSMTRNKDEVLISLPGGTGFRFFAQGASISVEDSIYYGQDHNAQKTNQIVLTAPLRDALTSVEWLLKLE